MIGANHFLNHPEKMFPLGLFFVAVIAYGMFSPWLGYYGDDWPGVYNLATNGLTGMVEYQSYDRPFWGWFDGLEHKLLGNHPLGWHLYAGLSHFFCALTIWLLCRQLWPNNHLESAAVALLFLAYPGILQEARGFVFGTIWLQLSCSIASFALMVKGISFYRKRNILFIGSISLAVFSWYISEYFWGLELVRPVILWVAITRVSRRSANTLVQVCKYWAPFVIPMIIYIGYRLFYFEVDRPEVDARAFLSKLVSDPVGEVIGRLPLILPDYVEVIILPWGKAWAPENLNVLSRSTWIAWIFGGMVMWLIIKALRNVEGDLGEGDDFETSNSTASEWPKIAIGLGSVAIVLGMLPIWGADTHYIQDSGESRYALPAIFGASLFATGVIRLIAVNEKRFVIYVSILTMLGVVAHVKSANSYRHEWQDQTELLRQLTWRVPALKPQTTVWIRSEVWRDRHPADYTYAMPMNLIYAPNSTSTNLRYWSFPIDDRGNYPTLEEEPEGGFQRKVRNLYFQGIHGQHLAIEYSPPNCLRIMGADDQLISEYRDGKGASRGGLGLDLIDLNANKSYRLPESIYRRSNEKSWCYYFQNASLASQSHDWEQILDLTNEVKRRSLKPTNKDEWTPFLRGLHKIGDPKVSYDLLQYIELTSSLP